MQKLLDQPAPGAAAENPVRQRGDRAAQAAERMRPSQNPVGPIESVLRDIGGAGLDHQMRDVDIGRALQLALLAVEAELGQPLDAVGRQIAGREFARGHVANRRWPSSGGWPPRSDRGGRTGTSADRRPASGNCHSRCSAKPPRPARPATIAVAVGSTPESWSMADFIREGGTRPPRGSGGSSAADRRR